ncbi:MAG TPA: hypothetical protein VLX64_00485 [Thermoplasmata archaeon]|nr:hypothetical protein [Thermoplasmata archaeon]HUJ77460.1 hypothetical protein [Thermoplasmata archaeon]
MPADSGADDDRLLRALADAIASAPRPVASIEVGIPLSIALGRRRTPVSCGGCQTGLEFEGIPATTNARLPGPFRLVLADGAPA